PRGPPRTSPHGLKVAIAPPLDPGASRVVTASVGFDRDTRPDPILPHAGSRFAVSAELGSTFFAGSYDYATIFGAYEHYWPIAGDHHALAVKLAGGVVVG